MAVDGARIGHEAHQLPYDNVTGRVAPRRRSRRHRLTSGPAGHAQGQHAMTERIHLRIPGPTPVPDAVRQAGARQMINHRGPEFRDLFARVTGGLKRAFSTDNEILILTCSGTGALEAAVVNHLSPADSVLAVSIGSFGDRFAQIAQRYGADVRRLDVEWGRAAEPDGVAAALREMSAEGRPAAAVLLTHNETS